jgi:hypothetical protein
MGHLNVRFWSAFLHRVLAACMLALAAENAFKSEIRGGCVFRVKASLSSAKTQGENALQNRSCKLTFIHTHRDHNMCIERE